MKAVVAAFKQEEALVGAFSMILQLRQLIVCSTSQNMLWSRVNFQTSHVSLDICSMTAESVMVTVVMATVMLVTCTIMAWVTMNIQYAH